MDVVQVTKTDIEYGKPGELNACPVALAMKAHFNADHVYADQARLEVVIKGRSTIYDTPKRVERFMDRFDGHKGVRAFSFELASPLGHKKAHFQAVC